MGRNNPQASTNHDAIVSTSCECISKRHFCGLAVVNVQRPHAVAEGFQLALTASTAARTFAAVRPGTGDLL
jgi:hypothetical protein